MEKNSLKAPLRILRLRQVIARTGLSRSTIYDHIGSENFPRQISLGARSVGWIETDIEQWIEGRIEKSRAQ